MGFYFSLISENKEVVIDKIKVLYIGTIWDSILKQNGVINENEYLGYNGCDGEWLVSINDFPKIIEYYENMIDGFSDGDYGGSVGVVRHKLIEPLKKQLNYRISKYKNYKIKLY